MNVRKNIPVERTEYSLKKLLEEEVDRDPFIQFEQWMNEAVRNNITEPNAMVLTTVNNESRPSSRIVLLKKYNSDGFYFFTNYESRKGNELSENSYTALLFFWPALQRQIRIEGKVRKAETGISDQYFNERPEGSKIGAIASRQSQRIKNRAELDINFRKVKERYRNRKILRPSFWGGYYVEPHYYEFWQGRPNRLHDRIVYSLQGKEWILERLAP